MSERYRIVTNGLRFRILIKRKFLCFSWWSTLNDFQGFPGEWHDRGYAEAMVNSFIREDKAKEHGWRDT